MYPNLWKVLNPNALNSLVLLMLRRNEGHAALLHFPRGMLLFRKCWEEKTATDVHKSTSLAELNDIRGELGSERHRAHELTRARK